VRALCRPHVGLGADGVIRIAPGREGSGADAFMDYRNSDGSVAEMCGNGVRCVAKYLVDRQMVDGTEVLVDTRGGGQARALHPGRHRTGRVGDGGDGGAGAAEGRPGPGRRGLRAGARHHRVDGNPHAVVVVDDIDDAPVATLGPLLQRDAEFPEGTNVEFLAVLGRDLARGRIWERGVGETLASGTGVAALAAAAHLLGLTDRTVTVAMPGGDLLVEWGEDDLTVTGPAWRSPPATSTARGWPG
jgi:diaminopimelate epimerase